MNVSAVDCPTLKLPLGAEAKRTGDTLAVWCSNNKRWSLRCQGTAWEGTMDTCDADPTPGPSVLNVLSTNWSSPYGKNFIIIMGKIRSEDIEYIQMITSTAN